MNPSKTDVKLNKFQIWRITSDPRKRLSTLTAILFSFFAVIAVITFIVPSNRTAGDDSVAAKALAVSLPLIIIGIIFWLAQKNGYFDKALADRETYLGVKLDDEDKIALYKWNWYGIVPKRKKLMPILEKYLDYSEQYVTGERQPTRRLNQVALCLFALSLTIRAVDIIIAIIGKEQVSGRSIFHLLLAGLLTLFFALFLSRSTRAATIRRALSKRQLGKISRMRAQLPKSA